MFCTVPLFTYLQIHSEILSKQMAKRSRNENKHNRIIKSFNYSLSQHRQKTTKHTGYHPFKLSSNPTYARNFLLFKIKAHTFLRLITCTVSFTRLLNSILKLFWILILILLIPPITKPKFSQVRQTPDAVGTWLWEKSQESRIVRCPIGIRASHLVIKPPVIPSTDHPARSHWSVKSEPLFFRSFHSSQQVQSTMLPSLQDKRGLVSSLLMRYLRLHSIVVRQMWFKSIDKSRL
jgi:hypothetical protein